MAFLLPSTRADGYMVLEDPRSGNTVIYFGGAAHDLSTLAPIFGKTSVTSTNGEVTTQFGDNSLGGNTTADSAGYPGYALVLTKPVTTVNHNTETYSTSGTTLRNGYSEVDYSFLASMDETNYPARNIQEWSNGSNTAIIWTAWGARASWNELVWSDPGSEELWSVTPGYSVAVGASVTASSRNNTRYTPRWYFDIDTGNNLVSGFGVYYSWAASNTNSRHSSPHGFGAFAKTNFPTLNGNQHVGGLVGYPGQFLGKSTTGSLLYFLNYVFDDHNQKIYNYDPASNTGSYLQEWSTTRTAAGTSVGGDRAQSDGFGYHTKLASSIFDDPQVADTKSFYVPFFDTNNDFHPYYFQWNTTNDSLTRNEDVSVTDAGLSNLDASSQYLFADVGETLGLHVNQMYNSPFSSIMFNETFVVNGTRYLTLGVLCNVYKQLDAADNLRTYVTYEVNASNPKILTYHSNVTIPATPRGFVWLNDAKTLFGIITETTFYMYSFNATTGWEQSGVVNRQFWAVGRDRLDRIFGVATSSNTYPDLHIITPALPLVVNITPESETYNYQGSTINTFITVDAVNAQGNREETAVTLVIDGSTILFGDDTTSKIVTTSTSGTVQVPIKVVAAGLSNIVSSVTI